MVQVCGEEYQGGKTKGISTLVWGRQYAQDRGTDISLVRWFGKICKF